MTVWARIWAPSHRKIVVPHPNFSWETSYLKLKKYPGVIGLPNASRFGFPRCDFRCHLLTNLPTDMLIFSVRDSLWKPAKAGIKRRKVARKKCWSYKFESFWGHFAIWAIHDTRRSKKINHKYSRNKIFFRTSKFSKLFFSEKNIFFFDRIFFMIQNLSTLSI